MNEIDFFYNDYTDFDKRDLDKIVKTVSKKPEPADAKALFLKRFSYEVFNAYRRRKFSKIKEEVKKEEPMKVIAEKPLVKPEIKKTELEEPPKPIYKKTLTTREILRSDGVVISAAYSNGIYNLIEPKLEPKDIILLKKLEEEIGKKISKDKKLISNKEFIKKNINSIAKKLSMPISLGYYEKIGYFLARDFINFGKIDGLLRDVNVREIICDGLNKPIKIHYKGEEAVSDVFFSDKKELDILILKFSSLANKKISDKEPFLSAVLPSGIRIQASLSSDLTNARFVIKK